MMRTPIAGLVAGMAALAGSWISEPQPAVTYYKDVRAILQDHCVECHRPGQAAPMPLVTYREVKPWAQSIRRVVLSRKMPPWPADGRYYHRFLKMGELETIMKWVDDGAPRGNPQDSPPTDEWALDALATR
jgi:hypothetical protein